MSFQNLFSFLEEPGRELDRFTGKRIQSSIGEFWDVTQTVLLENFSVRIFGWNHIWYVTFGLDEFSSKTV